jgi:hypothetical protein
MADEHQIDGSSTDSAEVKQQLIQALVHARKAVGGLRLNDACILCQSIVLLVLPL